MTDLATYYEGGTDDHWWLAPAGLPLAEALDQRVSPFYRTAEGARRALVARRDAALRAAAQA